jgi:hypothetical protein
LALRPSRADAPTARATLRSIAAVTALVFISSACSGGGDASSVREARTSASERIDDRMDAGRAGLDGWSFASESWTISARHRAGGELCLTLRVRDDARSYRRRACGPTPSTATALARPGVLQDVGGFTWIFGAVSRHVRTVAFEREDASPLMAVRIRGPASLSTDVFVNPVPSMVRRGTLVAFGTAGERLAAIPIELGTE